MKLLLTIFLSGLFSLCLSAQTYKGKDRTLSLEEKLNQEYCTGLFQSADGTILDVTSSPSVQSYANILDWLQGRVAGVQVYKSWTGTSIPVIFGGVPAIFVDEMQVGANYINSLNINDIAIIKVIKSPFLEDSTAVMELLPFIQSGIRKKLQTIPNDLFKS